MGQREEFLALFNNFTVQKSQVREPVAHVTEDLKKEHEEIMKLLNNEEALNKEFTKKTL